VAQAQLRLAQLYEHGEGVLQSFTEAVHCYARAAEQNSLPAIKRLGEIYLTGCRRRKQPLLAHWRASSNGRAATIR